MTTRTQIYIRCLFSILSFPCYSHSKSLTYWFALILFYGLKKLESNKEIVQISLFSSLIYLQFVVVVCAVDDKNWNCENLSGLKIGLRKACKK